MSKKVSIPWWVWMIIGAAISGYAKITEMQTDNASMIIFFYLGVLFLAVGVFKLIIKLIFGKKEEKHEPKAHATPEPKSSIIKCLCGTSNYSHSHYCHMCGKKLR